MIHHCRLGSPAYRAVCGLFLLLFYFFAWLGFADLSTLAFAGFMTALLIGLIAERKEHEAVNRLSPLKRVLLGLVCLNLFVQSASACPILVPDHAWTIRTTGGTFGLEGYRSFSCIKWGNDTTFVSVPFYWIVTVGVLVLCSPCFLGFCVVGRKN
jgi:hypothetical protein